MRISRLLAAPLFAGALLLTQAVGIGPARAVAPFDNACNYDFITFNACLRFEKPGIDLWTAVVGLDSYMPQRRAQEILEYGANFRASLWGDDNGTGRFLADLTLAPGWPASGPDGLFASFTGTYGPTELNEDTDGEDEIYAQISYFDYHLNNNAGAWVTKRTGILRSDFASVTGGGPGCLILC